MQAIKENKVYSINEAQKDRYLSQGFDILSDSGEVLEYSPLKKVTYSEYKKLLDENVALKAELESFKESSKVTSKKTTKEGVA